MLESLLAGTNLPNLHPAVLHFPIVLLSLAVPLEVIALWRRDQRALQVASVLLYLLGSLAALATWWSGRQAADAVGLVDAQVQLLISEHSDLALRTVWFFGVVAVGRLAVELLRRKMDPTIALVSRIVLLLPAAVGIWMLAETADRGGGLVYTHGVAVRGIQTPGPSTDSTGTREIAEGHTPRTQGGEGGAVVEPSSPAAFTPLITRDNGTMVWRPESTDKGALGGVVEVVKASPDAAVRVVDDPQAPNGLTLESRGMVFLLLPRPVENVLVIADLDLSAFRGRVGLVHHYQAPDAFECMVMESGGATALFNRTSAATEELSRATMDLPTTSARFAVSAAGSHLKGYIDGQTVVHGHRPDRGVVGKVGLMLHGEGRIRIVEVQVNPVQGSH